MDRFVDGLIRLVALSASMVSAFVLGMYLFGYGIPPDQVGLAAYLGLLWGGLAYALR